jgi:hypothetical protein
MEKYKNLNRDSGVAGYEIGQDKITVYFKTGAIYLYTYSSTGISDIEKMKEYARMGKGLCSFITKHVKKRFAKKIN